jgi:GNAT superfamily N-acetyltransferase
MEKLFPRPSDLIILGIFTHRLPMNNKGSFRIETVRSVCALKETARLFTVYAESLGIDLSYQDFQGEMDGMPGRYAPPTGELLLARAVGDDSGGGHDAGKGMPLGCVGLRGIRNGQNTATRVCEMKRLYVHPEARRLGLGEALIREIIRVAQNRGYDQMRLDTLPSMKGAIALYEKAGFERILPYYETPVAGTIFLARDLNQ